MASNIPIMLLTIPPLLILTWYITALLAPPLPPALINNKRIILLIAHPDDESMFFSPTLQALTNPALGNHLKVLCMSRGDSEGLGLTRAKELEKAALTLGVRRREDVFILDDPRFKDGMQEQWDPAEIAKVLASAFAPESNAQYNQSNASKNTPASEKESKSNRSKSKSNAGSKQQPQQRPVPSNAADSPPRASIDVLITFDAHGISSHPNHIALYHGAHLFLKNIMKNKAGYACPVALYVLPTINIMRKYAFVFDVIPTLLTGIYADTITGFTQLISGKKTRPTAGSSTRSDRVIIINDVPKYWKAASAMVKCHKSQMVWFRWGWISIGRYMTINDLRREKIVGR